MGAPFTDPRTGRIFDAYQLGLDDAVVQTIEHRKANPHFYPVTELEKFDPISVRQEILATVHSKFPEMFRSESNGSFVPQVNFQPTVKVCHCGGSEFTPIVCPTCSGQRITGQRCVKCGFIYPK